MRDVLLPQQQGDKSLQQRGRKDCVQRAVSEIVRHVTVRVAISTWIPAQSSHQRGRLFVMSQRIPVTSTLNHVTELPIRLRKLTCELPDGNNFTVFAKRFHCAELLVMTRSSNRLRNLTYELLDGLFITARETFPRGSCFKDPHYRFRAVRFSRRCCRWLSWPGGLGRSESR